MVLDLTRCLSAPGEIQVGDPDVCYSHCAIWQYGLFRFLDKDAASMHQERDNRLTQIYWANVVIVPDSPPCA